MAAQSQARRAVDEELRKLLREQNDATEDATFLVRMNLEVFAAYEERNRRIQSLRRRLADLDDGSGYADGPPSPGLA